MKYKRLACALLAIFMTASLMVAPGGFPIAAAENDIVREGLVSWFKGDQNTRSGQNTASNLWHDLVSGYDLPVNRNDANYFTEEGFRVNGTKHYFSDEILKLVNNSSFTIEIEFGEFSPIGENYNVFMNSSNDYFSLFRRVSENVIEWKFGGGNTRPKISDSLRYLKNHLLTFTCEYGGSVIMYVNGVEMARADCDLYMGADDLFIGQDETSRSYDALYKNIRFYSRPLSTEEVEQNARVEGYEPEELPKLLGCVSVAQPVTNIVGDIAMVRPVQSKAELESVMSKEVLPATALFEIDTDLRALDGEGNPFATVEEILELLDFRVLPCFCITGKQTADRLAEYLDEINFYDVQIMSANREVLKYARELLPRCYGILDLREEYAGVEDLSEEQLLDIRRAVKTYNAYVAVLPVKLCRNEDVQFLYELQVNVWAWGTEQPGQTEAYFALLSGAVGVVTDETERYLDIACNSLAENTMTRMPTDVGHRGIPSQAPECTLEGSILAYRLGATVIELDVYLTRDGHVVAMHDGNTGRTCNQDLDVEASSLAELKKLYVNKGYEDDPEYSACRIPTLDEYLEWFRVKNCKLFIEIKSTNTDIVTAIRTVVDKYGMYGQCSVITFNEGIMKAMRKDYPEMSVGALSGMTMNSADSDADMRRVMDFIGQYNGTHNPSYGGYDEADMRACMIRGVSVYPWTIDNTTDLSNFLLGGYSGLTTDYPDALGDMARQIRLSCGDQFKVNTPMNLQHAVTRYNGNEISDQNIKIVVLEGEANTTRNSITPLAGGELTFLTLSAFRLPSGGIYRMYTQPLTVDVFDPNAETEPETEIGNTETLPETNEAGTNGEPDTDGRGEDTAVMESDTHPVKKPKKGCRSTVSGGALLILTLGAAVLASDSKKRR